MTDRYLPGVPCWIELGAPDPEAAAAFYAALFGWTVEHGVARLEGRAVAGLGQGPPGWTTYVRVDDPGAAAARAEAAGGRIAGARLTDPAGAELAIVAQGGAELVNAPGTWNWSNLESGDPDGARAFYGAVFGWEAMAMGGGALMWRVPGYGDRLAELDPGLRARHAEAGIPPGFSDAVAWLVPGEGPARWSVTFAADDTDRIAARAQELGGSVLVAPYDVQGARVATIVDAQGADFTVSRWGA
jgi:predicted enzyme related to lactoylglutathione lyase